MAIKNIVYLTSVWIFSSGLYITIVSDNLIKKLIGLSLFQTSVIVFYLAIGKVSNGIPPIINLNHSTNIYSNPLTHVLMLTAIVVGLATLAVGLALIYKIEQNFNTINESVLYKLKDQAIDE